MDAGIDLQRRRSLRVQSQNRDQGHNDLNHNEDNGRPKRIKENNDSGSDIEYRLGLYSVVLDDISRETLSSNG